MIFNASKNEIKQGLNEAARLCEKIIEECTENNIRNRAVQILCQIYPRLNKFEEAKNSP